MPKYIDADKVLKWSYSEPRYSDSVNDRTDLRDFLLSLPTISPDDVRGVWKIGGYGQFSDAEEKWYDGFLQGRFFYCSVCKKRASLKSNYCPNCGARMTEVSEDAEN